MTDTTLAIDASASASDLAVSEGEPLVVVVTATPAPRCAGGAFVELVLGTAELSDVRNSFGAGVRLVPGTARYVVMVPTVVDTDGDDETLGLRVRSEVPWAEPFTAHTDPQRAAKLAALTQVAATISDTVSGAVPQVTITAGAAVVEGADAVFTLTADPVPTSVLQVPVVISQSGSFAADGELGTRLVTIPANTATATVTVQTVDDGAAGPDGSIGALFPSGAYSSRIQRVSVAVSDAGVPADDTPAVPAVTVTGGPAVTEGTNAVFTVTADPAPASDLAVGLVVQQSGAFVAAGDLGSKSVMITAGQTSATYTVATVGDSTAEPNGLVAVRVDAGQGYVRGSPRSASVQVHDDDGDPTVTITAGPAVAEGSNAAFTVTASHAPTSNLAVSVSVTDFGDVVDDEDDAEGAKTVTINSGSTSATYTVSTQDRAGVQGHGRVRIRVNSGSGYKVGSPSEASVTVHDDDSAPTVTITAGPSVTEGTAATFTVAASHAPTAALAVSVRVSDLGGDFVASGNEGAKTVTINSGSTSATYTVATVGDTVAEADGSVTVRIVSGSGYVRGRPSSASVRVTDDDTPPLVSITAGDKVFEGQNAQFTVTATRVSQQAVAVSVAVSDTGDFIAPADERTHTVTIAAGDTDATLTVATVDDAADEVNGKVTARLVRGSAYRLRSPLSASVAVDDDDGPPSGDIGVDASVPDTTVTEGEPLQVLFELTRPSPRSLFVPVTVAPVTTSSLTDNPADAGDYATPLSLVIPGGVTSHVAEIATRFDADTADEAVGVTLGALPAGFEGSAPWLPSTDGGDPPQTVAATQIVFVILDKHKTASLPVGLSVSPNPVAEGSPFTVTVSFADDDSAALQADKAIPITVTYPAGTDASDLGTVPSSITIKANRSKGSARIATNFDADQTNGGFTVAIDGDDLPFGVVAGSPLTHTVVISDTTPTVGFSSAAYPVDEGDRTVVTVELSAPAPRDITVPLGITPAQTDPAEPGDGRLGAASVTIEKGETSVPVIVDALLDADLDNEVAVIAIGSLAGRAVKSATLGTAEILITDTTPTLTLAPATLALGEGSSAKVTVTLDKPAPQGGVRGRLAETGGTAETTDITVTPLAFHIAEGNRTAEATVATRADSDNDDETTTITVTGLDPTRAKLGAAGEVAVTVYDLGGSQIGFSGTDENGNFEGFGGPAYIGEALAAKLYVSLAKAPTADVAATVTVAAGQATLSGTSLTFTPTDWKAKPFGITAPSDADTTDDTIIVQFALTSTDPAYNNKTWRLPVVALDGDVAIEYSFVGHGDAFVDIGGESLRHGLVALEIRSSQRVPYRWLISFKSEPAANERGEGARQDRDDYVPYSGLIPVSRDTGYMFVTVTDDNIVERTEYQQLTMNTGGSAEAHEQVTVRIRDDDVSYVQVIRNQINFSKKFYTDVDVVICAADGDRFTGDPAWAKPTLYAGATVLALPSQAPLAQVGGIVIMLPALDPGDYTWDHDGNSGTPQIPYLAYEEWDTAVVQHPQGFDVQIGGPADADCSVDFGGQPQIVAGPPQRN